MLVYHCAYRKKGKRSQISIGAAVRKKCRNKYGSKPCKYSFIVDDGKVISANERGKE